MTALAVLAVAGVVLLAVDRLWKFRIEREKRRELRRLNRLERGRARQAAEHRPAGTVRT